MERNFTNENFEDFLRQNADNLRMRPRAKVWKGISGHLNRRRRTVGFGIGILLLTTTSLGYYLVERSSEQIHTKTSQQDVPTNHLISAAPVNQINTPVKKWNAEKLNTSLFNNTSNLIAFQPIPTGNIKSSSISDQIASIIAENNFTPTIVDSYPGEETNSTLAQHPIKANTNSDPLTIESVINSYQRKTRKSKIGWQITFAPTVSYRKLSENKSYLQQQNNNSSNYTLTNNSFYDVNSAVTHKPDMGFELGLNAKYPIAKSLKLRAGLQLNVNRYDIKAFKSNNVSTTIRLNTRNNTPDSTTTRSNYSTETGKPNWLENFYFQVSAPIGIEMNLYGNNDVQFGVATTIQPTYMLGDRVYMITTDYKNYAQVPWLVRRWNVNTSLETFVSYSTGHLKWQVGPQVRYQLLSSFVTKYPVKENLFDFGLKVGISLNKQ